MTAYVLTSAHNRIHLPTCPDIQGRHTVAWAVGMPVDQIPGEIHDAGLRACPTCKPLGTAVKP